MEWNEVGSYNLGTALDGLLMICAGSAALIGASTWRGRFTALVVVALGLYIASRSGHWYVASLPGQDVARDGNPYAPWAQDTRVFLFVPALLMSMGLGALYCMRLWPISRVLGALVVVVSLIGYLIGGLTPIVQG